MEVEVVKERDGILVSRWDGLFVFVGRKVGIGDRVGLRIEVY